MPNCMARALAKELRARRCPRRSSSSDREFDVLVGPPVSPAPVSSGDCGAQQHRTRMREAHGSRLGPICGIRAMALREADGGQGLSSSTISMRSPATPGSPACACRACTVTSSEPGSASAAEEVSRLQLGLDLHVTAKCQPGVACSTDHSNRHTSASVGSQRASSQEPCVGQTSIGIGSLGRTHTPVRSGRIPWRASRICRRRRQRSRRQLLQDA